MWSLQPSFWLRRLHNSRPSNILRIYEKKQEQYRYFRFTYEQVAAIFYKKCYKPFKISSASPSPLPANERYRSFANCLSRFTPLPFK